MFVLWEDKLLPETIEDYPGLGYLDMVAYQKDLHYQEAMVILILLVIVKMRS